MAAQESEATVEMVGHAVNGYVTRIVKPRLLRRSLTVGVIAVGEEGRSCSIFVDPSAPELHERLTLMVERRTREAERLGDAPFTFRWLAADLPRHGVSSHRIEQPRAEAVHDVAGTAHRHFGALVGSEPLVKHAVYRGSTTVG